MNEKEQELRAKIVDLRKRTRQSKYRQPHLIVVKEKNLKLLEEKEK